MADVTIKDISSLLLENSEGLKKALKEYRKGEIDEEDLSSVVEGIVKVQLSGEGVGEALESQDENHVALRKVLEERGLSAGDLLMGNEETGPKNLHPLYEALLAERLQFDEDAPELRTGSLPSGVRPAPSVVTSARNPVMIGAQLYNASDKVLKLISEGVRAALGVEEGEEAPLVQVVVEKDPEIYQRGSLPAPINVGEITGSELAQVRPVLEREFAWKAISTTQGRRSVLEVLKSLVEGSLDPSSFSLVEPEGQEIRESFEWFFRMSHEGALQSKFCFVDTCAGYFVNRVKRLETPVNFCIQTVDRISDREVGWRLDVFVSTP